MMHSPLPVFKKIIKKLPSCIGVKSSNLEEFRRINLVKDSAITSLPLPPLTSPYRSLKNFSALRISFTAMKHDQF
jgi:hypothetical protein